MKVVLTIGLVLIWIVVMQANLGWIVKLDKDEFVGKWAIERVKERGLKWMLVGFEMKNGRAHVEGGQVVVEGK